MSPPGRSASNRYAVVDGLRGAFLVFMTLGHLDLNGHIVLQAFHPRNLSFADAASGFVLLSGLVAGLVYGRLMARDGFREAADRMLRRAFKVYLFACGLMLSLVVAALVAPTARVDWSEWLGPLTRPDGPSLLAAALLLQHVEFADILAQYIVYLALAPLVILACLRGWTGPVLAASGLLWLGAQFGLAAPAVDALEAAVESLRPDLHLPRTFNLFAWQLLFVGGLAAGVATFQHGPEAWRRRARLDSPVVLALVAAALAASAAFRLAEQMHPAMASVMLVIEPLENKNRLGLLDVAAVAATAWALAWLTIVAPLANRPLVRVLGQAVRRVLTWPFLTLLGRHSLLVYAWHVVLIYALEATSRSAFPVGEPYRSLEALAVIAALAIPAVVSERRARPRLRPLPA